VSALALRIVEALGRGTCAASAYALAAVLGLRPGCEGADEVRAAARAAGLTVDGATVALPTCEWGRAR
jgi:hypothetical protein